MIESRQLLHELARLKARQVAAGLRVTQVSRVPAWPGERRDIRSGPTLARSPGSAPLELHLVTDFSGRVLECDAELASLLAGDTGLKGADIDAFIAMPGQPGFAALLDRIRGATGTDTYNWQGDLRTAHAGDVRVVASLIAHPGETGTLSWLVRIQGANGAEAPKRSLPDLAFVAAIDPMMLTDPEGQVLAVNPAFTRLTGFDANAAVTSPASILRSGRHAAGFFERMWKRLRDTGEWSGEIWNRHADGEERQTWLAISSVADANGDVGGYLAVLQDFSMFKDAESRLHHLAHHDPLTGLPNRLLFQDRVAQQIALSKRTDEHVILMYMDLDRIDVVRATFGHEVADRLVFQAAARVRAAVREQDTVARLGGDAFTVLVPRMKSHQDASTVAGKLLKAMLPPFLAHDRAVCVSASIGVAAAPEHASSATGLLECAEQAAAAAKRSGGGCIRAYAPESPRVENAGSNIETALSRALERKELELHYQPQVDAASGRIAGAEALLRWRHPSFGEIAPSEFIRVAERTGKIVPIGAWVMREACRQSQAWQESGCPPIRIAVNVSGRQLDDPNFVSMVEASLTECGLDASLLEIELTETDFAEYSPAMFRTLGRLRELGVKIAIDDFGVGYSSLDRIKKLPVNRIKIDQSFVHDLLVHRRSGAIAAAIISLADALHLDVTAEGVESEAQYRNLLEKGCAEMQGFFFGRPMPAADFCTHLMAAA
ncbi:MAG: EAL domain-containing protein [Gammaproteobacteria bacterium]|nr:EAL domain-containing protein [Gammaproteobacteria bacterium]